MLTYADVCCRCCRGAECKEFGVWKAVMYADVCCRMLTYADACWQNARNLEFGKRWPKGNATELRPVIMCEYAHAMGNSTGAHFTTHFTCLTSTRVRILTQD